MSLQDWPPFPEPHEIERFTWSQVRGWAKRAALDGDVKLINRLEARAISLLGIRPWGEGAKQLPEFLFVEEVEGSPLRVWWYGPEGGEPWVVTDIDGRIVELCI